jgi:hypothetical protein
LRAAFAGVPGFENRISVLLSPVDGEGGSVHQNNDERFAGGFGRFEQLLLGGGKCDVGAVATREAGDVNRHLFAFKIGRETNEGDGHIGFFDDVDRLVTERLYGRGPLE